MLCQYHHRFDDDDDSKNKASMMISMHVLRNEPPDRISKVIFFHKHFIHRRLNQNHKKIQLSQKQTYV
jgi:hypothetical protein